jgi:hypothetical protein
VSDRKPFLLRLDPALFDALQRWASDDFRSLNGQIEFVLTRALKDAGRTRGEALPDEPQGLLRGRRRNADDRTEPGSEK